MLKQSYITNRDKATQQIGKAIAQHCLNIADTKPIVILLYGQLGAGKTTLVKGFAKELGIGEISSPTFIIVDEYEIKKEKLSKFLHIDLYRVSNSQEFQNLKIVESLKPQTITCIEWSENATPIIDQIKSKAHVIRVSIEHLDEKRRRIEID